MFTSIMNFQRFGVFLCRITDLRFAYSTSTNISLGTKETYSVSLPWYPSIILGLCINILNFEKSDWTSSDLNVGQHFPVGIIHN